MHYAIPVFVTSSAFDWSNFIGGIIGSSLGAILILGIERCLNNRDQEAKKKAELQAISDAFDTEVDYNARRCLERTHLLEQDLSKPLLATDLDTAWLDKFSKDCIDYRDEDSRRLFSYLHTARTYITKLGLLHTQLDAFCVHGSAVGNYQSRILKMNQSILDNLKELNTSLKLIKDLRKGIKIHLEDVKAHPLVTLGT